MGEEVVEEVDEEKKKRIQNSAKTAAAAGVRSTGPVDRCMGSVDRPVDRQSGLLFSERIILDPIKRAVLDF